MATTRERALGAMTGLALGDALGMPTQSMSPQAIAATYGPIDTLREASATQPIAPGMPAGSVTDDTEQALLTAQLLIDGDGLIDPHRFASTLLAWEDDMRARGSLDLLGPSTKLALEQVRAGADPRTTGTTGTTNGAAMRVTPVGIAVASGNRAALCRAVYSSCQVTHDTVQGLHGALLIAAAVSHAVDGASAPEAVAGALETVDALAAGADGLEDAGHWSPKPSVRARARFAVERARELDATALPGFLREMVGTSVESAESVPCALVLACAYADDPFAGLCAAAALGGDTDTIGAMAGAVLGAAAPQAWPDEAVALVRRRNDLPLEPVCDALLELRRRS